MLKAIIAFIASAAITFGLFVFMHHLISGGAQRNTEDRENVVIDIVSAPPASKVDTRRRVPPPPPPPAQPPKPAQAEPEPQQMAAGAVSFNMPQVTLSNSALGLAAPSLAVQDAEATPIVRIEPKYPLKAEREGREGWVELSFTIDEVGGVTDIKIIAAEPRRMFDKAAKNALKKWKYKPKVVDGKAVKQPNMSVKLKFELKKG